MLKFFRQIRQQLIGQGSIKKYMLYAVGEILLVVIGILIALQINNWNEQRKNKQTEQKTLQAILNNLEEDSQTLQQVMQLSPGPRLTMGSQKPNLTAIPQQYLNHHHR